MSKSPAAVWLTVANMDKERPGDRAYLRHLRDTTPRPRVMIRQEVGHGLGSVRITASGLPIRHLPLWVAGRVGVHRGIDRARIRLDGETVRIFDVHGLHVRTSGRVAQDAYYALLTSHLEALTKAGHRWVVAGDFNRPHRDVARMLGGTGHGRGVVGIVVSPGLQLDRLRIDDTGMRCRWTDHPSVTGRLTLARTR